MTNKKPDTGEFDEAFFNALLGVKNKKKPTKDSTLTKTLKAVRPRLLTIAPDLANEFSTDTTAENKALLKQNELAETYARERNAELVQKRRFRNLMFWCFFLLLLLQHSGLVALMYFAVEQNFIEQIQGLLSVIVTGTLGETYAIFRIMVKFVFSPGNFDSEEPAVKDK